MRIHSPSGGRSIEDIRAVLQATPSDTDPMSLRHVDSALRRVARDVQQIMLERAAQMPGPLWPSSEALIAEQTMEQLRDTGNPQVERWIDHMLDPAGTKDLNRAQSLFGLSKPLSTHEAQALVSREFRAAELLYRLEDAPWPKVPRGSFDDAVRGIEELIDQRPGADFALRLNSEAFLDRGRYYMATYMADHGGGGRMAHQQALYKLERLLSS